MAQYDRFTSRLRNQLNSSYLFLESLDVHGVPDEQDYYRIQLNFDEQEQVNVTAVKDFVKDTANELEGHTNYKTENFRKDTGDEIVFNLKIETPSI